METFPADTFKALFVFCLIKSFIRRTRRRLQAIRITRPRCAACDSSKQMAQEMEYPSHKSVDGTKE